VTRNSEELEQLPGIRSAIGKRFSVRSEALSRPVVTAEGLLDVALMVGDLNPLYFDEAYARTSPVGRLTASPAWFGQVLAPHAGCRTTYISGQSNLEYHDGAPDPPKQDSGPPHHWRDNLRAFLGSVGWEYVRAPEPGDEISATGQVFDVQSKYSRRLGPFALVWGDIEYRRQGGELLARGIGSTIVYDVDRRGAGQVEPPAEGASRDEARADVDEVSPVEALKGVWRRAHEPFYWEQVQVGAEIAPLLKGTLDHAEIAAYTVRAGKESAADVELARARDLLLSGDAIEAASLYRRIAADPAFDFGMARHVDDAVAQAEGAPGAFDIGVQRASWAQQAITNWVGDHGTLLAFSLEIRGFVIVGDAVWCKALVKDKRIEDSAHVLDLQVWVENQRGERVAVGTAVVELPATA
jgi:acyl dehydratase